MIRQPSMLQVATDYLVKEHWLPTPVAFREKRPVMKEWNDLRLDTPAKIAEHFTEQPQQNIGILLGAPSHDLIDVDLDCTECLIFARLLLPDTRQFGRPGNPVSHWLFSCADALQRTVFQSDGSTVLEIRGSRHMTVFPPSVHPSGEQILWIGQQPLHRISYADLYTRCARVAAGAVLARVWPRQKGHRHECEMALAGILLRSGFPPDLAEKFILRIASHAGTPDAGQRAHNVIQTTLKRLEAKQPVTGWSRLRELLAAGKAIEDIPDWLGYLPRNEAAREAQAEREAIRDEAAPGGAPPPAEDPAAFVPPAHWRWLDVAQRRDWACVSLRWTIKDLIAQGSFVLLAAETQTGKSLLGLFLSHSMLHSGKLFDRYDIQPVEKILYMGLEDPDRRFDARLADIEHSFPAIEPGRFVIHVAPSFTLTDPLMVTYLEDLIVRHSFSVVIVDTYQKATPGLTSFDDEKQGVILHRLANLSRKHNLTIIVLDHVRKRDSKSKRDVLSLDDVKGTSAKPQNADCIILVERTPDRKQIKLQSFSKDSDQNIRILLDVAPKGSTEPKFKYAADLEQLGTSSRAGAQERQEKVLQAMPEGEWLTCAEIAKLVGGIAPTVRRYLKNLADDGKVDVSPGGNKTRRYCRLSLNPIARSEAGN